MKKIWESVVILFAVYGFWGMIYPDLCFTNNVVRPLETQQEAQDSEKQEEQTEDNAQGVDLFSGICEAGFGQVRVRSRLLDFMGIKISESKGQENVSNQQRRDQQ